MSSAASTDWHDLHPFDDAANGRDSRAAAPRRDVPGSGSDGADDGFGPGAEGAATDFQEGGPRSWLGRRGLKRWRPEEPPPKPPEDGEEGRAAGGDVPVATKFGRKRWKG